MGFWRYQVKGHRSVIGAHIALQPDRLSEGVFQDDVLVPVNLVTRFAYCILGMRASDIFCNSSLPWWEFYAWGL